MAAKTTHNDYKGHIAFIETHSTHHTDGALRTMKGSDYIKMADQLDGITQPVLESVHDHQEKVIGAGVHVLTNDLEPRIEKAREAGDDTSTLKNTLRIATAGGSTEIEVRATRTRQNPRTGEPVTKHGVVDVSIDANKRLPSDAVAHARERITKALGLTETATVTTEAAE